MVFTGQMTSKVAWRAAVSQIISDTFAMVMWTLLTVPFVHQMLPLVLAAFSRSSPVIVVRNYVATMIECLVSFNG